MGSRNRADALVATMAAATALAIAACGSSGASPGPLHTLSDAGGPYVAMSMSGVKPGEPADAEAYVFNEARDPVKIVAITVVALPGIPVGTLADVGLQATGAQVATEHGWPPPETPVKPAIGAELPHGQSGIIFGITASVAGRNYAVAGLRVDYEYHDQRYSALAWGGDGACTGASWTMCVSWKEKVNTILEKMAGIPE